MAILNTEIVFLIVTYKEKYYECDSYLSLLESFRDSGMPKLNVMVFDNTMESDWDISHQHTSSISIDYYTEKNNRGISFAYNFLAKKANEKGFKWMVLLDQDTKLPLNFIKSYLDADENLVIHCPQVLADGHLKSPSLYKGYRSYALPQNMLAKEINLYQVSCINSGLLLNIAFFLKIGGYNEQIELDFCDHDFLIKLKKTGVEKIGLINCKLNQNFSFDTHNLAQALVRYKMFVRDIKGFYKGKNKLQIFFNVDLPHLLKLTYQHKTLKFFSIRL